MNIYEIRKNYAINKNDVYLNHAATAPISNHSIERIQTIATEMQRPLSEHFYRWLGILEDTRRLIAELINAHPAEIAFCQNTSTALSLIANAIPFKSGDRILVPRNEFPSNIYIWQSLQTKGVHFEFFDLTPGITVVETLKKINLDNIRLISISAVSYVTGRLCELKEISIFCRERNILICYDAIQALGTMPFDVSDIQPDFLASGAQKWLLGSVGAGFVYARKEWLEKLTVPLVGWTSVKYPEDFSLKELDFATEMTRFEPGLPDILPIVALNQSLRDLSSVGWDFIYKKIKFNTEYLTQALNAYGIKTFAQEDQSAGIVSFKIPEKDLVSLQKSFSAKKIHITQRQEYIRVSPHFYNTQEELDLFLSCLSIRKTSNPFIQRNTPTRTCSNQKNILLTGATGILGKAFAKELAAKGHSLTIVARCDKKLNELKENLQKDYAIDVHIEKADFNLPDSFQPFLHRLKTSTRKYDGYINCAGIAEVDEFINLSTEKFKAMLQINCIAAFELMQLFLTELKTSNALGILNIVSGTARCGYPLLSGYAASQATLWSLGEVLARELKENDVIMTTYVAPPMHSRMQKRLGRAALRYFKLSGEFPYAQAQDVAKEGWQVFLEKKALYINRYHRWTLRLNALLPSFINKRIKKIWKV